MSTLKFLLYQVRENDDLERQKILRSLIYRLASQLLFSKLSV